MTRGCNDPFTFLEKSTKTDSHLLRLTAVDQPPPSTAGGMAVVEDMDLAFPVEHSGRCRT